MAVSAALVWALLAAGVAALCALGVLFTVTRSPWLGAGAGATAALVFARETRRWFLPVAGLAALLVVVAVFFMAAKP
jgi:hypothetical protein